VRAGRRCRAGQQRAARLPSGGWRDVWANSLRQLGFQRSDKWPAEFLKWVREVKLAQLGKTTPDQVMLSEDAVANVYTKSSSFSVASTAPSVLKTRGAQQDADRVAFLVRICLSHGNNSNERVFGSFV
jgi:hypothetical protein